ncbi:MAG: hypothetical protein CMJ23_09380 [Phycisphaerae bacterium]|nr:hypothetical protein [Phycisphaerae bacterium]
MVILSDSFSIGPGSSPDESTGRSWWPSGVLVARFNGSHRFESATYRIQLTFGQAPSRDPPTSLHDEAGSPPE